MQSSAIALCSTSMTSDATRLAGIYLLTPDFDSRGPETVFDIVQQSLNVGVRAIQYRDKSAGATQRLGRARRLAAMTRAAGAVLIVNDSIEIALDSGADGLHIGREDGDVADARRRVPHHILGVSCYNELERARAAVLAGAD